MTKSNDRVNKETGEILDSAAIAAETLYGDLCKCVVDEIKALPDVWQKLTYDRQRMVIDRVKTQMAQIIRNVCDIIDAKGRPIVIAQIESVTFKDGIKVVMSVASSSFQRHELSDRTGQAVMIVIADPDEFMGGEMPEAQPDQRGLPLGAAETTH